MMGWRAALSALAVVLSVLTAQAQQGTVVSFLGPQQKGNVPPLQPISNALRGRTAGTSPAERGVPSWGSFLTATDNQNPTPGPTKVRAAYTPFCDRCQHGACLHVVQWGWRSTRRMLLQGNAVLYMSGPETLAFNITLDRAFNETNPLQSVLLSVPQFINSSAATLGVLYGANATAKAQTVRLPAMHAPPRAAWSAGLPSVRSLAQELS